VPGPRAGTSARAERAVLARGDVFAFSASFFVAGISTSIVLINFGVEPWVVALAGTIMFSATGELALAGVLAGGGSLGSAVASALLVSARFGLLAIPLSTRFVGRGRLERMVAAYMVVDPSVVMAMKERTPALARQTYWRLSGGMCAAWVIGSVAGVLIGSLVPNPRDWGMDVAFPALLLAITGTAMRASRTAALAAATAAAIALVLTPFVPAGIPVLCAVGAALIGLRSAPPRPAGANGTGEGS